ncbi:DUF4815 domain-containing protein [Bartonella sp. B17]
MRNHESNLENAFDRAKGHPEQQSVVFYGRNALLQKAELNEMQTIIRGRHDRLGKLVAKDGDRIEGATAIVDIARAKVTLSAGKIALAGDIFPVKECVLENIPMSGRIEIGVHLTRKFITHLDDPSLLGQELGSLAEGEPGAAREIVEIQWIHPNENRNGEFYSVYVLQDGTILDQKGPSLLEPAINAIAAYDRAHGHYVVKGCYVTALGHNKGAQIFTIQEGEANINGRKSVRHASLRLAENEKWDEAFVPGETHIYKGNETNFRFSLNKTPIAEIKSILLTKEKTATVTRGAIAFGQDSLPDSSIVSVLKVVQGTAEFKENVDFTMRGNIIDWSLAGKEPKSGSTYRVTYRYRDKVEATNQTSTEITVSGGAEDGDIIVSYTWKMPRIDRIGLLEDGSAVYIKGLSAPNQPLTPQVPSNVLSLASIHNDWMNTPVIKNDAFRSIPYSDLQRVIKHLDDLDRIVQLERIKSGINAKDPMVKKGIFVDGFIDQSNRDLGTKQDASVGNGVLELPIKTTFYTLSLDAPATLDWSEDVIISQQQKTACTKINPYANFEPLPASITLNPIADFWTEHRTEWGENLINDYWVSGSRSGAKTERTEYNEKIGEHQENLPFLRQIPITYKINGFGKGEILKSLTFDGLDVMPKTKTVSNDKGEIAGSFTIPANIPAGTKQILVEGMSGAKGLAMFTGQGVVDIATMRRNITIRRWWYSNPDPQAQLFLPDQPRQIVGVRFHVCKIGNKNNDLIVEQVTTDNGYPTQDVVAQATVSMKDATTNWMTAYYNLPVTTDNSTLSAFVIKTDDNKHSVSFAKLGDFDTERQQWITMHPYVVGPRFSSVNAQTWTAHQDEALAFEIIAAKYKNLEKQLELGEIELKNCSDLQIRAAVELPSNECSVIFEVIRKNGTVYQLLPAQVLSLSEYLNETVTIRAILKGTKTLSPILYAPVKVMAGEIKQNASYISRAFPLNNRDGDTVNLSAHIKTYLPAGATVSVALKIDDGSFKPIILEMNEPLSEPLWTERKFSQKNLHGYQAQLKIELSGSPQARIACSDFGVAIV